MKKLFALIAVLILASCKSGFKIIDRKDVVLDSISIRAIYPANGGVWFGGSNSRAGFIDIENEKETKIVKLQKENTDFRSIGFGKNLLLLNAGSPANLHEMSTFGYNCTSKIIYTESGDKVFYDSMFINPETGFGVIIGDPTENCLSILFTEDNGSTWKKIPCENLPKTVEGEAAFAASDTNVKIIKNTVFIISGGVKSRLYKSQDKGKTWEVFETPIIQGNAMTGAFSMDFYNNKKGIIVGGNYENQKDNQANKAYTNDGGKTWQIIAPNQAFGYASCVQFVPKSNGKQLIACGTSGVYFSENAGKTWVKFLNDTDFYTLRFSGLNKIYLAGKNKVTRVKFR